MSTILTEVQNDIAEASSLCGACYEACPVKIPLHDMLVYLRRRKTESGYVPITEKMAMKSFGYVMSNYKTFEKTIGFGKLGQSVFGKDGKIQLKVGPLKGWNSVRVAPALAKRSFRDSWKALESDLNKELSGMKPDVQERLNKALKYRNHKDESNIERGRFK